MQSHISFANVSGNVATCFENFHIWYIFGEDSLLTFLSICMRRWELHNVILSKAIYEERRIKKKQK